MDPYILQIVEEDSTNKVDYSSEVLADKRITANIDVVGIGFKKLLRGDLVMVHAGTLPIALVKIEYKLDDSDKKNGKSLGEDYRVTILDYYKDVKDKIRTRYSPMIEYSGIFDHLIERNTPTYIFVVMWAYELYIQPRQQEIYRKYLEKCKTSNWVEDELYKYEWSHWIHKNVNFELQTDEEILEILIESQKQQFTNSKGVQFIKAGAREKLSKFIGIEDVAIYRKCYKTKKLVLSDFKKRNTSFTIASCYLSALFPEDWYPVSTTNFNESFNYFFNDRISNSSLRYIDEATEFFKLVEEDFKENKEFEEFFLTKFKKKKITQTDWNWLIQDFFLFITKEILPYKIESVYGKLLKNYSPQELNNYFSTLKSLIVSNNIEYGDTRCNYTITNSGINFTVGQLYTLNLYKKEKKGKYGILSRHSLNEQSEQYNGIPEEPYYTFFNKLKFSQKDFQDINLGVQFQLNRTTKSGFRKHNNDTLERYIFDFSEEIEFLPEAKFSTMKKEQPLNKILYGPPGTGKTYKLKNEYFHKYTLRETSLSQEQHFSNVVAGLTWWQVIALALLEIGQDNVSSILANRWVAEKANLSESKNVRATIWGTLQMHTIEESETVNYKQRQVPLIFDKKEDKSWVILKPELDEQSPEIYEILDSVNNFKANPDKTIENYDFVTFHQSFSYEDFIEGIKPVMPKEGEETKELQYQIEDGVFKTICGKAAKDPENRYAIFIDEINRGNVSAIFGELITLIELDKRKGEKNEISIKLPYSKTKFSVPSNLDIYGTMNTADRSVEALDTALRRRFSFEELLPKPELLKEVNFKEVDLVQLLTSINERIEILIDKDHQIGHSYFFGISSLEDLKLVFQDKIIPLLEEYFYGDFGKIGLVLGESFIEEQETKNKSVLAKFKAYTDIDFIAEKKIFRLKNISEMDTKEFITIYTPEQN